MPSLRHTGSPHRQQQSEPGDARTPVTPTQRARRSPRAGGRRSSGGAARGSRGSLDQVHPMAGGDASTPRSMYTTYMELAYKGACCLGNGLFSWELPLAS